MARAVDIVRLQSGAKAEKKADRTAAEGLLGLKVEDGKGAMVEINIETDFAARNPKFSAFVERAVDTVLAQGADDVAAALETNRQALVQEVGENINVRRAVRVDAPAGDAVAGYLHQDGKKGALVAVSGGAPELGRDLAMHVTAMRPLVLSPDDMPPTWWRRNAPLYEEQTAQEQAAIRQAEAGADRRTHHRRPCAQVPRRIEFARAAIREGHQHPSASAARQRTGHLHHFRALRGRRRHRTARRGFRRGGTQTAKLGQPKGGGAK